MSILLERLDHAFHYISQWDPQKTGTTKGGYIQGNIEVPSGCERILLACVPHEENQKNIQDIQPCLLHTVFKESDRKRNKEKEPMPSFERWRLVLDIEGKNVVTKDKYGEDYRVAVVKDGRIVLGYKGDELNLVILFPKTDSRGENQRQEFIKTILRGKGVDASDDLVDQVNEYFIEDQSVNLHRMRISGDFLNCEDDCISSCKSEVILNNKNKMVGALRFSFASPLKSCSRGGRTVMMVSEFPLSKDVVPRFLVYDKQGNRCPAHENLISQPTRSHMQNNCMIMFTTPKQDKINIVLNDGLQVKLAGCRGFDGYQSQGQFNFEFILHPETGSCMFCDGDPDGSKSNVGESNTRTTKGFQKRKMTNIKKPSNSLLEKENTSLKGSSNKSTEKMNVISSEMNVISSCKSSPCSSLFASLQTCSNPTVSFDPNTTLTVSYSSDKKSDNVSLNKISDSWPENSSLLQTANDYNNMEIPSTVQNLFTHNQTDAFSADFNITSDDVTNVLNMINSDYANECIDITTNTNSDIFNHKLDTPNNRLTYRKLQDTSNNNLVYGKQHDTPNNNFAFNKKYDTPNNNLVYRKQYDTLEIPQDLSFDSIQVACDNTYTVTPYIHSSPSTSPQAEFSISPSQENYMSSDSLSYTASFVDNFSLISSPHSDMVASITPPSVDRNLSNISFNRDVLSSGLLCVNDNLSLTSSSSSSSRPFKPMYNPMISPTFPSSNDDPTFPAMISLTTSTYSDQGYSSIISTSSSSSSDEMYPSLVSTYMPPSDCSSDDDLSHNQLDGYMSPSTLFLSDITDDIPKPLLSSPQLYCLAEILHKLGYIDDDPTKTLAEITVKIVSQKSITVLETVGIPFKDRESLSYGLSKKREWRDYFPSRTNKTEISTLILHRFEEALDATISRSLSESLLDYDPGKKKLSRFLLSHLERGFMTNYILVSTSRTPVLWRVSHPATTKPQSVGIHNSHCVTAMVQTNKDQELPTQAFDILMDTICSDLAGSGVSPPQYLASYQEIRGGGPEGAIGNINQLRRRSRRKHCTENTALF